MKTMKERYGVEDLTLEQEATLAKERPYEFRTRHSKIRLVNSFEQIKNMAENMIQYCKHIPEENNEAHSERVYKLAEEMSKLYKQMDTTIEEAIYGRN